MIEIGEYVRTKEGRIDKVDALYGMIENTVHLEKQKWFDIKNILKHSKNLIDLIEEGDYVNGVEVVDIVNEYRDNQKEKSLYMASDMGTGYANQMFNEHIKTIVTKEQFAQNCYKVKE